ncbi:hypothetical protein TWF281_004849 [Arthrobotrys megalospora]
MEEQIEQNAKAVAQLYLEDGTTPGVAASLITNISDNRVWRESGRSDSDENESEEDAEDDADDGDESGQQRKKKQKSQKGSNWIKFDGPGRLAYQPSLKLFHFKLDLTLDRVARAKEAMKTLRMNTRREPPVQRNTESGLDSLLSFVTKEASDILSDRVSETRTREITSHITSLGQLGLWSKNFHLQPVLLCRVNTGRSLPLTGLEVLALLYNVEDSELNDKIEQGIKNLVHITLSEMVAGVTVPNHFLPTCHRAGIEDTAMSGTETALKTQRTGLGEQLGLIPHLVQRWCPDLAAFLVEHGLLCTFTPPRIKHNHRELYIIVEPTARSQNKWRQKGKGKGRKQCLQDAGKLVLKTLKRDYIACYLR